jgi:1,4-dihydroxy-2-naphthoyl-CoA hydrolase
VSRFDELIGTEWLESDEELARGRIPVTEDLKQPFGLVHGGVFATLAESICSRATALAVWKEEGMIAVGQSNSATFMRPITEGHVNALARRRHRGRTTWVWDVEVSDDEGRLCALVRMTIAIRPREP